MNDLISRQAVLYGLASIAKAKAKSDAQKSLMGRVMFFTEQLPSVKPQEPTDENLHREREQAYMQGYEDASKRFRQEPCEDAISRQAVHEAITRWAGSMSVLIALPTREVRPLLESIHKLPPVKPQEKTGHWVKTPKAVMGEGYMWYCDKCEHQVYQDSSKSYPSEKYCPNCGTRMVEPQESEKV